MNAEIRSVIRCALEAAIEDYYLSGESVQAFEDALAWLDAQPEAPEPDWRKAPKYANAWVASPFGTEAFFFNADTDVDSRAWEENDWGWILADIEAECESVKCNLPIGIDWRTTLRRRPEVTP